MKIESRVVAVSWIPSEAVKGAMKAPFELGIAHYDEPLPDVLGDLDDWRKRDMFRVANDLRAWIGVDDDGKITGHGYSAGGRDRLDDDGPRLGQRHLPGGRRTPPCSPSPRWATAGCGSSRPPAAAPACRRPGGSPSRRSSSTTHPPRGRRCRSRSTPTVGRSSTSSAPARSRATGSTAPTASWPLKSGMVDFKDWYRHAFGDFSPWGGEDSPALVAEVESAMERQLSPGDHGRGQAQGPQAEGGRRAHHPGRGGRRDLPAARRRHPGERRRRGDRQPRPGRAHRRAGGARGREANGHTGRREPLQGRRSPQGGARPRQAGRGQRGPPSRGATPLREGPRARCARVHPGARARLRAPRRQHVVRRAGARRRRAQPRARRGHRAARPRRAAGRAARSAARCCSATCTGTTPRACRSPAPSTTTAPRCACASRTRTTATRPSTCCAGPCRRRTSRSAPRASAATGPSRASTRASTTPAASRCWPSRSRTRAAAPSATGCPTAARRSPTSPTTARPRSGPGPDGWGPYHDTALALAAGVDLLIHDAQHTAEELPSRVSWGHSAADYPVRLAELAGAKAVLLFHHDPIRTDDEVDAIVADASPTRPVPVTAAAEGTVIEL